MRCVFCFINVFCFFLASASVLSAKQYASFVIDVKSGKILHSENADSPRYPASLTKMMTLYLTFESIERKKIKKTTPVFFSRYASSQPPMKLGIQSGHSITVEQAIQSLITRSANDTSVALAELIGGSNKNFAYLMNKKAKKLGMQKTFFCNPNGLPDKRQRTTARDMAILGIALRKHFPQYYTYFSTRAFNFKNRTIFNHNKLLGVIKGVDGIKTGYTRDSGYNLVSSANDGNRQIVAVVMGGKTSRTRDDRMKTLIKTYMPMASIYNQKKSTIYLASESLTLPYQAPLPLGAIQTIKQQNIAPSWSKLTIESLIAENIESRIAKAESDDISHKIMAYAEERSTKSLALLKMIQKEYPRKKEWNIRVFSPKHTGAIEHKVKKILTKEISFKKISYTTDSPKKTKSQHVVLKGFSSEKLAIHACKTMQKNKLSCLVILKKKSSQFD